MASPRSTYEEAIAQLNSLQSNVKTIQDLCDKQDWMLSRNVYETTWCLEKCGIKLADLNRLNAIHISGTKGKGSTCAFIECILRQYGLKTGFFSSPHLIHVRERIRINGRPLSEDRFTAHFHFVYNRLKNAQNEEDAMMPAYFKFLTVLAFYVFLEERVDVAIVEVGIGGEHDCTNIIPEPVVCGITALDYDHISLLGSTIESIAWHKAGIFKKGSAAVVSPQTESALQVIRDRAFERECLMRIAPPYNSYKWPDIYFEAGISGDHQRSNISLALQLSKLFLQKTGINKIGFNDSYEDFVNLANGQVLPAFTVPQKFINGICLCDWPGRSQILTRNATTYYLDGAHTPRSTQCCIIWYINERKRRNTTDHKQFTILLFHCTAERKPELFLPHLLDCDFDLALFCPTKVHAVMSGHSDLKDCNYSEEEMVKVRANADLWSRLSDGKMDAEVYDCIEKAIARIKTLEETSDQNIEVLVTGSLRLVGGVMSLLGCHT